MLGCSGRLRPLRVCTDRRDRTVTLEGVSRRPLDQSQRRPQGEMWTMLMQMIPSADAIGQTECDASRARGAHTFVTRVAFIQPATLSRASSSGSEGRKTRAGKCLAKWTMCSPEPACHFTPTPILSDGEVGAVLHLLALFQSYDAATSLIEDRDLTEAAHEARLATEARPPAGRAESSARRSRGGHRRSSEQEPHLSGGPEVGSIPICTTSNAWPRCAPTVKAGATSPRRAIRRGVSWRKHRRSDRSARPLRISRPVRHELQRRAAARRFHRSCGPRLRGLVSAPGVTSG
jgi:hypothetical protein